MSRSQFHRACRTLFLATAFTSHVFFLPVESTAVASQLEEVADNELLEAIELEFRSEDGITSDTVDVQLNQGVVTLSGETNTLLMKRRAVLLVGGLKGVRSIVNQIRVLPTSRSDDQILADIRAALNNDPATDRDSKHVSIAGNGAVILSGTVDSFVNRILTESVVAGVRGVTDIKNELKVHAQEQRSADVIRPEIVRRFELNPRIAEGLIEVEVDGKNVMLKGSVGSVNEKDLAEMLCWVAGVESVDASGLSVDAAKFIERRRDKFATVRSDIEIQKAVTESLLYDPRVKGADIEVVARYGAISLFGDVSSFAAKQSAGRDAMNSIGVRRVLNHLKVKDQRWLGDVELTKQALEAIQRDAHLAESELHASSHFGKMYVNGEVNTQFEKDRVGHVLADLPGVRQIINRVNVDVDWQEKSDEEILEDTNRRMRWSPFLDVEGITISVDDGIVTLQGKVDTWHERKSAASHAMQSGARRVKNELKVRSASEIPPGLKASLVPNRSTCFITVYQNRQGSMNMLR